ncbi:hypothetical protein GCM10010116_20160 [Microbispora rosea subsp. aerata]|nr:hypothetical protein [Microbispora rosea]GGO10031.1 hypothetical protein GCM10010116_20160 [Microbispora rosea subsp. aerata]GIH53370.1 hypothetical protein Mro02_02840 [Microbispora rosea subsp. aerata]GLJ83050.1 hypothetical protein GCM10017588_17760 [Microbispora rosea subsp. aerata]
MTVDQSNKRSFYATDLGWIPDARATLVIGEEISKNRNVLCATRVDYTFREALVWVDETRWSRWRSATERLFAKIRALQDEERAASLQWYPPFINPLLWRIVNLWRIWWLRKTYEDKMAKIRADFNAALAEYQKQTEDLPQYVREYMRQLIEREALRLQQERERRAQRAAAVAIAARAVWSYRLETDRDNRRSFSIYLSDLDEEAGESTRAGLTPRQIQDALDAERAEHPHTPVRWGRNTELALKEAYGSAPSGWRALTGTLIDSSGDSQGRPTRSSYTYGPSSNYGSDTAASHGSDGGAGYGGVSYGGDGGAGGFSVSGF